MTSEQIRKRLVEARQRHAQVIADAQAWSGAVQMLEVLEAEAKAEEAKAEPQPPKLAVVEDHQEEGDYIP